MHRFGLTFSGLRNSDGRVTTGLRGHGFLAAEQGAVAAVTLMSHPLTAIARRPGAGFPAHVSWMRLRLRAGLALDAHQARAWGLDLPDEALGTGIPDMSSEADVLRLPVPGEQLCPDRIAAALRRAGLDALVMPPNRGGAHAIFVIRERMRDPWVLHAGGWTLDGPGQEAELVRAELPSTLTRKGTGRPADRRAAAAAAVIGAGSPAPVPIAPGGGGMDGRLIVAEAVGSFD